MSESPYQPPVKTENYFGNASGDAFQVLQPLYEKRVWIRIAGICMMLIGGIYTITIIGAIFGAPALVIGLFFYQAAGHFEAGFNGEVGRLREGSQKLSLALLILGILSLIFAVIMVLYVFFIVFAIGLGVFTEMSR